MVMAPTQRPLIYVAGPYSSDPMNNTREALRWGRAVWDLGGCPVVPHLSGFWDFVMPMPYQHWMDYDAQLLLRCDAVFRFPGDSFGADAEVELAKELGIPVFFTFSDLATIQGLAP